MKLYVDIDPQVYDDIKALVAEEQYDSVEQFLRAAADNQLALERMDAGQADRSPDHSVSPSSANTPPAEDLGLSTSNDYDWGYEPPSSPPTRKPAATRRPGTLLFSQYYRFMPLKFALLELARVTTEHGGPIALSTFREHMREAVVPLRTALATWETQEDVKKQDRFSTGLPNPESKNPDRSMKRYLDHYVGHFRSEAGEPAGLGHQLGFVSIHSSEEVLSIALSSAGAGFLSLDNPLLSKGPSHDRASLSEREQTYLLGHIRRTLPVEYNFIEYVYQILDYHEGTYTDHLPRFRMFLESAPGFTDTPSKNRVRSHTAGTISRMVELGLLERGASRGEYETLRPPEAFRSPRFGQTTADADHQPAVIDHQ